MEMTVIDYNGSGFWSVEEVLRRYAAYAQRYGIATPHERMSTAGLRKETDVITLRPLRWPDDRASLLELDTSFTTDRVFQLQQTTHSAKLDEVVAEPPIHKSYSLADSVDLMPNHDWVTIVEHKHGIAGVASMVIEAWNRRAVLHHLYVTSEFRRIGLGQALVTAAIVAARERNARCVWIETQTVNYGAVLFYHRMGFEWCGFDTALYDPRDADVNEVALFFSRDLR
jgi:ribosomal protein S18 acetylase RimI-like enzyme